MNPRWLLLLFILLVTSGCLTGNFDYRQPAITPTATNSVTVPKPADAVWKELIPRLASKFFVINNLDKASGLINLSYSGDPTVYVDCGTFLLTVSNARGERSYHFPGASQYERYEAVENGDLFFIERRVTLEGRVNLIVHEATEASTVVTANTRYIVTRTAFIRRVDQQASGTLNDTISFDSGGRASFPQRGPNPPVSCRPTGKLESDVLELVK